MDHIRVTSPRSMAPTEQLFANYEIRIKDLNEKEYTTSIIAVLKESEGL